MIEYLSSRLDALEGLGKMIDYNEISYTEIEDCIEDAIGKDTQKEKLIL